MSLYLRYLSLLCSIHLHHCFQPNPGLDRKVKCRHRSFAGTSWPWGVAVAGFELPAAQLRVPTICYPWFDGLKVHRNKGSLSYREGNQAALSCDALIGGSVFVPATADC
jgi:hypothetical protein